MGAIALARSGVPLRGRLVVTEVADEETSGAGALHLIAAAGLRPDGVIVGEQTLNRVAVGEKGTAGVEIVVSGRTAHGALPWEGANAIEGMARVIIALAQELQPRLAERTHPYFMPSSASVNMIDGGVKSQCRSGSLRDLRRSPPDPRRGPRGDDRRDAGHRRRGHRRRTWDRRPGDPGRG